MEEKEEEEEAREELAPEALRIDVEEIRVVKGRNRLRRPRETDDKIIKQRQWKEKKDESVVLL